MRHNYALFGTFDPDPYASNYKHRCFPLLQSEITEETSLREPTIVAHPDGSTEEKSYQ